MLTDDDAVTDLGPLKYVRSITAPLSPLQAQRFSAKFPVYVLNGYGQAEIGEVIGWTAADAKAHPDKVGAVGRPHPGVDIKLRRRAGIGCSCGRRNTAAGARRARSTPTGFVDTGDLARIDDDGFVWIEGPRRRPDQPRRQQGLPRHGRGGAAAVARRWTTSPSSAQPDERLGEVPVAFLVRPATSPTPSSTPCAASTSCRTRCRRRSIAGELPRNDAGKLLRAQVSASPYRTLLVRRDGPIGWLIFNRPAAGNAMDATMLAELERAWQELDADPDVRVIINTGEGERVPDRARRRAAQPRSATRCASSRDAPSEPSFDSRRGTTACGSR